MKVSCLFTYEENQLFVYLWTKICYLITFLFKNLYSKLNFEPKIDFWTSVQKLIYILLSYSYAVRDVLAASQPLNIRSAYYLSLRTSPRDSLHCHGILALWSFCLLRLQLLPRHDCPG